MASTAIKPCWSLAIEIILRVHLFIFFWVLEDVEPFERVIQPEEWWLYKNPHKPSTVPTAAMFITACLVPLFGILIFGLIKKDKTDLRQSILGLTLSLSLNGFLTNVIKLQVGRPRPDYFFRCFPSGIATPNFKCNGDMGTIIEGRKSFPSGHSSWSFAGLGFLSWYLAGKLRCFQTHGRGHGWRVCLSVLPSVVAMAIALTRYSDYRHHWQDITIGSVIGFGIAWMSYRQYYPSITRPMSQLPYISIHPGVQRAKDELEHIIVSGETLSKKASVHMKPELSVKSL